MRFAELAERLPELERSLARQYARARKDAPPPFRPYVDSLREFTLRGGKRFRALLVLAGFHLVAGRDPAPALPAAAAFEHFQSWMLVHDDIIDRGETRRGRPTVHRLFEEEFRGRGGLGDAAQFGLGLGITVGDLAEPFTVEALLASPVPGSRRLAALAEYVRMTRETAFGQALDIRNGTVPVDMVRESDVLAVHRYKTAAYTVASPLRVGAILAGGRPGLLADLDAVGLDLGIAFQLRDDVLGTGFEADAPGKSANDLQEGKRTLLVVKAWERGDTIARDALRGALGNLAATAAELEAARGAIRSTGSLDYSERKIRTLYDRALSRVHRSREIRAAAKPLIREIAEKLVQRVS